MSLAPGTRIGPYEVLSVIGAGGMGEVYRARDTRLGGMVAIKFTRTDTAEATEAKALFEREGRAIAALSHPRICSVHDVGCFASQNYLVMECLDGETLEQRIRRGRLPLDELFSLAIAVAEGLVVYDPRTAAAGGTNADDVTDVLRNYLWRLGRRTPALCGIARSRCSTKTPT